MRDWRTLTLRLFEWKTCNRDIAEDKDHTSYREHHSRMDKKTTGEDNLYYELESPSKDSEARIYDDVAADIDHTSTVYNPCNDKGNELWLQYPRIWEEKRAVSRKRFSIGHSFDSVTGVYFNRCCCCCFSNCRRNFDLALSIMMSRNDNTGSKAHLKDSEAIYGKYSHRLFSLRAGGNNVANCITCRLSARRLTHVGRKRKRLDSYTDRLLSMQLTCMRY